MFTSLEKSWPYLSIALLMALLVLPFAWPAAAEIAGILAITVSVGAVAQFSAQEHIRAYRAGRLDRAGLIRTFLVDVSGLLLAMAATMLSGSAAGRFAGEAAMKAAERTWAGSGTVAGLLGGLLVGLAAGLAAGFVVRATWGKLFKKARSA